MADRGGCAKAREEGVVAGKAAVGLDIGTSAVRAAEISIGKGAVTLRRFGQVGLPAGAVRDGEVADVEAVADAIKRLWREAKFGSKKVAIGVSNSRVVVRQVDLAAMPAAEMRKSLPYQVQDYIPMPIEETVLDYHPLEERVNDDGGKVLRVLLVAAARDMVMASVNAARTAGLEVVTVDLNPFAVLRSLATVDELGINAAEGEAIVQVGANVTNIVVHQGGVPRFVRILLMGGDHFTQAVADRMGVPLEQAEAFKQTAFVPAQRPDVEDHPANRALESTIVSFVEEVRGSLDYYLAQPTAARIGRIVLSGGGCLVPGFPDRLAAATRLPVEFASVTSRLTLGNTGLSAEQLDAVNPMLAVAVGLAMGLAS